MTNDATTSHDPADATGGSTPAPESSVPTTAATPFGDLDAYLGLRRLGAIALSPDGSRLVVVGNDLDSKKTKYTSALWDVDPSGERAARRLTRSAPGEAGPTFLPDGSVVFVSKRPGAADGAADADDAKPALWLLPADGGEARQIARWDGGIGGAYVAADAGTIAVTATAFLGTATAEQDAEKRKQRKDLKVAAILHDAYPVRYWDHDLGPEQPRLYLLEPRRFGDPRRFGAMPRTRMRRLGRRKGRTTARGRGRTDLRAARPDSRCRPRARRGRRGRQPRRVVPGHRLVAGIRSRRPP